MTAERERIDLWNVSEAPWILGGGSLLAHQEQIFIFQTSSLRFIKVIDSLLG